MAPQVHCDAVSEWLLHVLERGKDGELVGIFSNFLFYVRRTIRRSIGKGKIGCPRPPEPYCKH